MHKKTFLLLILGLILISFLLLIAFYAISFEKSNTAIAYINKNVATNYNESDWISESNYQKLQIVDDDFITEDNYINLKNKYKIKFKSLNCIVYFVDVKAIVNDWETGLIVAECSGTLEIEFKFSNMKWRAIKVTQGG